MRIEVSMQLMLMTVAMACLATAGCASDRGRDDDERPPAPVPPRPAAVAIAGTQWRLIELSGTAALPALAGEARSRPTLRLDPQAKRASGSTGVNQFSGSYELSGDALQFGPMISTRRGGPPELMRQETAYLDALKATARVRLDGGLLVLLDAGGATLARFEAVAASEAPLAGARP